MSDDRRPEKLMKYRPGVDPQGTRYTHVEASPADLLAVVRRGVESGTIKGEVHRICSEGHIAEGIADEMEWCCLEAMESYLVIPWPYGGSET